MTHTYKWARRNSESHEIYDYELYDSNIIGHVQVFKNKTACYWFNTGDVAKPTRNINEAKLIVDSTQCGHVLSVRQDKLGTISCNITTDGGEYEHVILTGANKSEYESAIKAWVGASVRMAKGKNWVRI